MYPSSGEYAALVLRDPDGSLRDAIAEALRDGSHVVIRAAAGSESRHRAARDAVNEKSDVETE